MEKKFYFVTAKNWKLVRSIRLLVCMLICLPSITTASPITINLQGNIAPQLVNNSPISGTFDLSPYISSWNASNTSYTVTSGVSYFKFTDDGDLTLSPDASFTTGYQKFYYGGGFSVDGILFSSVNTVVNLAGLKTPALLKDKDNYGYVRESHKTYYDDLESVATYVEGATVPEVIASAAFVSASIGTQYNGKTKYCAGISTFGHCWDPGGKYYYQVNTVLNTGFSGDFNSSEQLSDTSLDLLNFFGNLDFLITPLAGDSKFLSAYLALTVDLDGVEPQPPPDPNPISDSDPIITPDPTTDPSAIQLGDLDSDPSPPNLALLGSVDNPFMPNNTDEIMGNYSEFEFNIDVNNGEMVFVDPFIAIGYDYILSSGPNFASVLLPNMGDNSYDLWEKDNNGNWFDTLTDLTGGQEYYFGGTGLDAFRIMGIETSLGLDPDDPDAFVTGLTFAGSGGVNMRQIAVTAPVPEPASILLMGTGLVGFIGARRNRHVCSKLQNTLLARRHSA